MLSASITSQLCVYVCGHESKSGVNRWGMVDKKEACRKYGQLIREERSDAVIKLRKWLMLCLNLIVGAPFESHQTDESFLQIYQI